MTPLAPRRAAAVQLALGWLGTPYHDCAAVPGAGVDCGMLLVMVYRGVGILPPDFDPRPYPARWFLHRNEERYLELVRRFADERTSGEPMPGDVALWRYGRCFSHAGVVVAWPRFVHAHARSGSVCYGDDGDLGRRERVLFVPRGIDA